MDRAADGILIGRTIDLNADAGEGFDAVDAAIFPLVTSVSIACGMHAGGPSTMRRAVELALEHGVAVGAHPGLPDREGFGRRAIAITPAEAYDLVLYQLGAFGAIVRVEGATMAHVKPHGALYTMAARDAELADAIASAVCDFDDGLTLYGLAGSELIRAAEIHGLAAAGEVFADRRYGPDGHLLPRDHPDALVGDPVDAARRVREMLGGHLPSAEAPDIAIEADTVCLHGDSPGAGEFARRLREELLRMGLTIQRPGRAGMSEQSAAAP